MTGGNYWAPDAILNQNAAGTLRLGGAMTAVQVEATTAGNSRAQRQLNLAAYVVTALSDCNGNGVFDVGTDLESAVSNMATATAQ